MTSCIVMVSSRIDYIISKDQQISMLEINTTPGMTPTSFIPQQVRAAGLSMTDVLTDIVRKSVLRYGRRNRAV
ncbi:hypothetical protein [Prevotella communis]|uniref:hypothetical protein n=1 Tax=Prevotella communis TaxID=2913614 RepID=UPI002105AB91|nr:hypothetical protein [Prevotella communis]